MNDTTYCRSLHKGTGNQLWDESSSEELSNQRKDGYIANIFICGVEQHMLETFLSFWTLVLRLKFDDKEVTSN